MDRANRLETGRRAWGRWIGSPGISDGPEPLLSYGTVLAGASYSSQKICPVADELTGYSSTKSMILLSPVILPHCLLPSSAPRCTASWILCTGAVVSHPL